MVAPAPAVAQRQRGWGGGGRHRPQRKGNESQPVGPGAQGAPLSTLGLTPHPPEPHPTPHAAVLPSTALGNSFEREGLLRILQGKGSTVSQMLHECLGHVALGTMLMPVTTGGRGPIDTSADGAAPSGGGGPRPLGASALACHGCRSDALASLAYQYRRAIPRAELPSNLANREDCWCACPPPTPFCLGARQLQGGPPGARRRQTDQLGGLNLGVGAAPSDGGETLSTANRGRSDAPAWLHARLSQAGRRAQSGGW